MRPRLVSALLLVVLLCAWEAWCRAGGVSALVLPPPSSVAETLWGEAVSGRLWPHLRATATEMALGLAAGTGLGLGAGILLAEWPALHRVLHPYVLASQLVPKLALGPLLILWFGFGLTPTVVITALICFFPLLENTLTGLDQVDGGKRELFRMLGASRARTLWRLKLPSALPVILAGFRVAIVLALVGAVVGEFVGGRQGLGAAIIAAQSTMDSSLILALFVVITALGMAVYEAARALESLILRRYPRG
ncbi:MULTISPECIES: ABC transporter permease [Methylobacterium]|jgi:NitT/TauT family transport system permease protein|uniref:ABC transporter permease n=1 Tax=Methylobacterium TaxID=407 RepID=UPI0008F204C7|nr:MULTISPECIES: ABC transporter permease [Methylobacterium]MBZ6411735.1 ABC transporter permease [Methylobacterium sp.]MBK3396217.1 ABC transporter permease [Methylobacterium ajmalii]MBK3410100.1 ABC transporter permease [Methylobacterium ajmalii]MBK3421430.1 ABC transporter permease [Methylobacterium ajmalii]SFE44727.1 NitT/TauT family transport system permease protein [Methylobacterium sp. yr596]